MSRKYKFHNKQGLYFATINWIDVFRYATPNDTGNFDYIYQHKDHLGNVRVSYTEVANPLESTPIFSDSFENISNWNKSPTTIGYTLSDRDNTKKKTGTYSGRIDPPLVLECRAITSASL
jgi:hypothetical protein